MTLHSPTADSHSAHGVSRPLGGGCCLPLSVWCEKRSANVGWAIRGTEAGCPHRRAAPFVWRDFRDVTAMRRQRSVVPGSLSPADHQ